MGRAARKTVAAIMTDPTPQERADYVVRKLEQFQKAGVSQVIFFKQAGRIPHQTIMKSLRLIGKHILPHFNPHRTIASEEIALAAAGR